MAVAIAVIGPQASELLIQQLHRKPIDQSSWEAPIIACLPLGLCGDGRAFEPLVALLRRGDYGYLPLAACHALGLLGDARAVEPLIGQLGGWSSASTEALSALKAIGTPALDALSQRLESTSWEAREIACIALGKIGDTRAVEPLIGRLGDTRQDVRHAACDALERLGEAQLARAVIAALAGQETGLRELAQLGAAGDLRAMEPLARLLKGGGQGDRLAACRALSRYGGVCSVQALLERLEDESSAVRRSVCAGLGQLGDPRAVEPLLRRLQDLDSDVRRQACLALGHLRDARAVQPLQELLQDPFTDVRRVACTSLGQLGDARAVEPLSRRLGDSEWSVRRDACEALGEVGDARAVPSLLSRLADGTRLVREAAGEALGQLREGRLADALLGALDGQEQARLELARLVAEQDVRWVDAAIAALGLDRLGVRACLALARAGDAQHRQSNHILCGRCLARFERRFFAVESVRARLPLCRLCGRASTALFDVERVVAVLDSELGPDPVREGAVLRVGWLQRSELFDFDLVEIALATDHDVERFCIAVGNDTDEYRRPRYRKMPVAVDPACGLSASTLNMLRRTFGNVWIEGAGLASPGGGTRDVA